MSFQDDKRMRENENMEWNLGTHEPYNLLSPNVVFLALQKFKHFCLHVKVTRIYVCAILYLLIGGTIESSTLIQIIRIIKTVRSKIYG
jgi:hypothetical protein